VPTAPAADVSRVELVQIFSTGLRSTLTLTSSYYLCSAYHYVLVPVVSVFFFLTTYLQLFAKLMGIV
jgi:type VI protein secretion system component VasA